MKLFFSDAYNLSQLNGILIILALFGNWFFQAFCVPTLWASALLILCSVNMILYPVLMKMGKFIFVSAFLNGVSSCMFLYCIIFLDFLNLFALIFVVLLFGLIVFIPPFFIIQLLVTHLFKPKAPFIRISFLSGVIVSLLVSVMFSVQYVRAFKAVEASKRNGFQSLERTFMTEKIVGMYFKYHTEVSEYDGWRPPLHEPALIIGQWFNGTKDPLDMQDPIQGRYLPERIALYKKFFPGEPVKLNCTCAYTYNENYYRDKRLK